MSLFRTVELPCPACGTVAQFDAVNSVNADRRPDLRDEVLDRTFQRTSCEKCAVPFRLDPDMTYLDVERGQWIAAHPFGSIGDWAAIEKQDRLAFDRGYGDSAAPAARKLGTGLQPRITFGWEALREKLMIVEQGLDDIEVELTKIAVLRGSAEAPLTARTELRLINSRGKELAMAWIVAESGEVAETLVVPKGLYDEIAVDTTDWQPLREEIGDSCFVDMQRLMLPVA